MGTRKHISRKNKTKKSKRIGGETIEEKRNQIESYNDYDKFVRQEKKLYPWNNINMVKKALSYISEISRDEPLYNYIGFIIDYFLHALYPIPKFDKEFTEKYNLNYNLIRIFFYDEPSLEKMCKERKTVYEFLDKNKTNKELECIKSISKYIADRSTGKNTDYKKNFRSLNFRSQHIGMQMYAMMVYEVCEQILSKPIDRNNGTVNDIGTVNNNGTVEGTEKVKPVESIK